MKGVLLGTDFLQQGDNVKILETNTNIGIFNEGAELLNLTPLFDMLVANSITDFHFIYTEETSFIPTGDLTHRLAELLEEKCIENNITYTAHTVAKNSITVPAIDDADNKFILRQSYDTSALIDSTYCADKLEFGKLMSGSSYSIPTYFSSSDDVGMMDDLSSVDYTSTNPNLIEKSRYAVYDRNNFPKISKLTDSTQLDSYKTSLDSNNLIQEFIYDDANIIDNYYSVLRSLDIIYGTSLDTIHLGGYAHSAMVDMDWTEDDYEGTQLLDKPRNKYLNKGAAHVNLNIYHTDEESKIYMFNGTTSSVEEIQVGDVIKTVTFDYTYPDSDSLENDASSLKTHYISGSTLEDTLTWVSSSLISSGSQTTSALMLEFVLADGTTWFDSPRASYVIEASGSELKHFEFCDFIIPGDKILKINPETSEISTSHIDEINIVWQENISIYNLDFEPYDYFLVDVGYQNEYAIMHNACNYCGDYFYPCGNYWCDSYCYYCSAGGGGLK